jgi:signal transduction histidine kinase
MKTEPTTSERAVLDATGTGTWVWDARQPNAIAVRWPGVVGTTDLRDGFDDENWHILSSRLQQSLLEDTPFEVTVQVQDTAGDPREAMFRGSGVPGDAERLHVVGLCWFDGIELQADRQAQWAPLAKLSHELRSPLAAVVGLLREAGERMSDSQVQEVLDAAQQSCDHMSRVIEDMLEGFRAGESVVVHSPEPVAVDDLLDQLVPATRERAADKGLDMGLWRDDVFPDVVLVEPVALRRILTNLLDNAIKYTDLGAVALRLEVDDAEDGAWLCFDVIDTGAGMTEDEIARVFEPFARGEEEPRETPGLGIGLALSQQLAAALDGRLEVTSTPGEGSRFRLRIPARVPETAVATAVDDAALAVVPQGRRVLVVDDHPLLAKLTGRALARLGCDVDVAETAREALASVERRIPDVVILDLELPDVSGWDLCRQLSSRAQLACCRFVAYSGSEIAFDEQAMHESGFDACFVKPASAEELLGA